MPRKKKKKSTLWYEKKAWEDEEMTQALFEMYDIAQALHLNYFLTFDTAKQVKDDLFLEGEKLTFGVLEKDWTEYAEGALRTIAARDKKDIIIDDKYVRFLANNGVPIEIKIVKTKYKFLEHLDNSFYKAENFPIPNPWEQYWGKRGLT